MDPLIRPIRDDDSIDDLTALLHRAYRALADMGFRYTATHQTPEVTRKRLAGSSGLIAELDGKIVGTVTWCRGRAEPGWPQLYQSADIAFFGQFGVEPDLQRRGIGLKLLRKIECDAKAAGCTTLALDTAEGAAHLIAWYERYGFRHFGHTQWRETNYRSVIMTKPIA